MVTKNMAFAPLNESTKVGRRPKIADAIETSIIVVNPAGSRSFAKDNFSLASSTQEIVRYVQRKNITNQGRGLKSFSAVIDAYAFPKLNPPSCPWVLMPNGMVSAT
jgi:hypothetical protein